MDREYITAMFNTCSAHSFRLYKVDKNFLGTSSFSDAVFSMKPIKQDDQDLCIAFGSLFQVKENLQYLPENIEHSFANCSRIYEREMYNDTMAKYAQQE